MNNQKLDQLLLSTLNDQGELHTESFEYKSIFLSSVVADKTNARFLPAILIQDEDAKLFANRKISKNQLSKKYHAEDHVLIGKSCVINCLKYDSADWKKANVTINSIIELGNNISVSELIQAPTLYPISDGKFQVLTGHRRFFALVYANGYGSAAQFKVYNSKPLLTKVKQFQENASREDLSPHGKLMAFESAMSEIELLNIARLKTRHKKLTVREIASNLGISMGAFDNYNVLTRYSCVVSAYNEGLIAPFIKVKKIILDVESEYKTQREKSVLNITDKKNISDEIYSRLFDGKRTVTVDNKPFRVKPIKLSATIKTLLTSNIMELESGIDWDSIDWEDSAAVSRTLANVIEFLENTK